MAKSKLLRMDMSHLVESSTRNSFFTEIGLKLEGRAMVEVNGRTSNGLGNKQSVRCYDVLLMAQPLELSRFLHQQQFRPIETAPVNSLGYLRAMFAVDNIDELISRLTKHALTRWRSVQYETRTALLCSRNRRDSSSGWRTTQ